MAPSGASINNAERSRLAPSEWVGGELWAPAARTRPVRALHARATLKVPRADHAAAVQARRNGGLSSPPTPRGEASGCRRAQSGIAAVEFAIAAPILTLFLAAGIVFGHIGFVAIRLHGAVNQVAHACNVGGYDSLSCQAAMQTRLDDSKSPLAEVAGHCEGGLTPTIDNTIDLGITGAQSYKLSTTCQYAAGAIGQFAAKQGIPLPVLSASALVTY